MLGVTLATSVSDAVRLVDCDEVAVADADAVGDAHGVTVSELLTVPLGVMDDDIDGVSNKDTDGDGVTDVDCAIEMLALALAVADREVDGVAESDADNDSDSVWLQVTLVVALVVPDAVLVSPPVVLGVGE